MSDVRREDDERTIVLLEALLLLFAIELGVKREDHGPEAHVHQLLHQLVDLALPGEEYERVASLVYHTLDVADDVQSRRERIDREQASRHVDDRSTVEVLRDPLRVDGRTHDDEREVRITLELARADGDERLLREVLLVPLVDDDDALLAAIVTTERSAQDELVSRDEAASLRRGDIFETRAYADGPSELLAILVCDTLSHGPRRESPRLGEDDAVSRIEQEAGDAGRFPSPCIRDQDDNAVLAHGFEDRALIVVDGEVDEIPVRHRHGRTFLWLALLSSVSSCEDQFG